VKFSKFYKSFPDESTCVLILKEIKVKEGIICKKCSNDEYYWKNDKKSFECKKCKYRMSLKRGTIMENSNLPLKYWMSSIVFFNIMKEDISALALQKEIGHKRYEPIWSMVKRIKNMTEADHFIYKISDYIAIKKDTIYLKNIGDLK
jgi:hypothetical protein